MKPQNLLTSVLKTARRLVRDALFITAVRAALALILRLGQRLAKQFSLWLMLALVFLAIFAGPPVHPAAAQGSQSADHLTVLLILDNSGSMKENDPQNLRFSAARLFAALLDEQDRVGVVAFATHSQRLTKQLVEIGKAGDKQHGALLNLLTPQPADGYTDVKAAFTDAKALLTNASGQVVIIFLTDGKPEISQPYPAYETETLALIQSLQTPVLSIALTPVAQTPFLNQLAAVSGGQVIPAEHAADLLDVYLNILGQLKDRTVLGNGESRTPGLINLVLDPGLAPFIERASFILARPAAVNATLIDPGGAVVNPKQASVANYLEDPGFILYTVERPSGGKWNFDTQGNGLVQARLLLHSRLRLQIETASALHEAGRPLPIRVRMVEEQSDGLTTTIIGQANFSALITRPDGSQEHLDRFYDNGSEGDLHAGDGEFARLYFNTQMPGLYKVKIQGWKGVIPVSNSFQIQMVEFPRPVIDAPQDMQYSLRNQPIHLQMHLEGGDPHELEQDHWQAQVKTPSGKLQTLPLAGQDGHYSTEFQPDQDGDYQVTFKAPQAQYLKLAYEHTATVSFRVKIIPQISLQNTAIEFGKIDIHRLDEGLAFTVIVTSTSFTAVTLNTSLQGIPGLEIQPAEAITILPNQQSELSFTLLRRGEIPTGLIQGHLFFSADPDVELMNKALPIQAEIYQPMIRFLELDAPVIEQATCMSWRGQVILQLAALLPGKETLYLRLETEDPAVPAAWKLETSVVSVSPGQSNLELAILPSGKPEAGEQRLYLVVETRSKTQVSPERGILLRLQISPVWVRCRQTLQNGGALIGTILICGLFVLRGIRSHNRPPQIAGTLRHWPAGEPQHAEEIDLTALHCCQVSLGQGTQCQVSLPDASLQAQHANLLAVQTKDQVQVMLQPIGEVRMGYRSVQHPQPLQHGDTFTIGQRTFQYLSDQGA